MEVKGTVVGAGDIAMKMTIVTTARGIHRLEGNTVTQPLNNASFWGAWQGKFWDARMVT